jgi:hypothetical protein
MRCLISLLILVDDPVVRRKQRELNLKRKLRAIETRYKGYRFRSRTEARWAVFFDYLGLNWEYEKEGFQLPSGTCYLPDFWVESRWWLEVKGQMPEEMDPEFLLCQELAEATGTEVLLVAGTPSLDQVVLFFPDGFCFYDWHEILGDGIRIQPAIDFARAARFEFNDSQTPTAVPLSAESITTVPLSAESITARQLMAALKADVLGVSEDGRQIKVYSEANGRTSFIPSAAKYEDLLIAFGEPVKQVVSRNNEDAAKGMYPIREVREAIALLAGKTVLI